MSAALLTLSFHLPSYLDSELGNLREDALFKHYGLASGLLSREAMQNGYPTSLQEQPRRNGVATPASGLVVGEYPVPLTSPPTTSKQVSLLRIGANAWWRPQFLPRGDGPSEFEEWLRPLVTAPAGCLLLCGHHGAIESPLPSEPPQPVLWGAEDTRGGDEHRYFTAFVPKIVERDQQKRPELWLMGHPYKPGPAVLRAQPFDCTEMLRNCRLIVLIGCNGVTHGPLWQAWASCASEVKPIVLGWRGVLGMPRDVLNESFSTEFWSAMRALVDADAKTLADLHEKRPESVIRAWGQALLSAYGNSRQRSLWYASPSRGAGAVDPNGGIWGVNAAKTELTLLSKRDEKKPGPGDDA